MHETIIAQSGGGKGIFTITRLLETIDAGQKYVVVAFPHPPDWKRLIGELYARYGESKFPRLIIDRPSDNDRVIMQEVVLRSQHPDPWKRMDENEENIELAIEMIAGRRNLVNLTEKPVLEKGSYILAGLKQQLDGWVSDSLLPYALKPHTDFWYDCLDRLPMTPLRQEIEGFQFLSLRDQLALLEPVYRLWMATLDSAAIKKRTCKPPTLDLKEHLNKAGIIIICGGGVSRSAFRAIVMAYFARVVNLAHHGLEREGEFTIDELINFQLGNDFYARTLATARYTGLSIRGLIQSLGFPTPEITDAVLDNSDLYWGRVTNPKLADIGAAALRGAMDPNKVHHHDEIIRSVPDIEYEERVAKGSWTGPDGSRGDSKNVSIVPITKHKTEVQLRPVYEPGQSQAFWQAAHLQEQQAGDFWIVRKGEKPHQIHVPMLEDSWSFEGLAELKVEECIRKLKAFRPDIYVEPILLPTPVRIQKQKNTAKTATERLRQNGTQKSKKPPQKIR